MLIALVALALQSPTVDYTLTVDARDLSAYDVTMRVSGAPDTLRVAMAVHPEYDNRTWRFLRDLRADTGTVTRVDSTLWRVVLPHGAGTLRYRVTVPPQPDGARASWRPFLRATGALLGGMDSFLYLADFPGARARVTLALPSAWRVATGLTMSGTNHFAARDAATLLDAPILAGDLRAWSFRAGGVQYRAAYWPLPDAAPFDTASFVDDLARLARAATDVVGGAPFRDYTFLFQDGAYGGLEHANSVLLGAPSAELRDDVRRHLAETAHEYFHAWNEVRLRPAGWGGLSYRPPTPTTGLWWAEGATMYFADVLLRRIGRPQDARSRAEHVAALLERYYEQPANQHVAPERASLAANDPPGSTEATFASPHLQGELLSTVLDLAVRDSTHDRRGLDAVMRRLYARTDPRRGYTGADVERAASAVCGCDLRAFFAAHVAGPLPPDVDRAFASLGWRVVVDSVVAADDSGRPLPDLRIVAQPPLAPGGRARLQPTHPASAWARAGVRAGTEIVSANGTPVASFADLRRVLRGVRVGDRVTLDVVRDGDGRAEPLVVTVASYSVPRVRLVDARHVTGAQRARRSAWLAARP